MDQESNLFSLLLGPTRVHQLYSGSENSPGPGLPASFINSHNLFSTMHPDEAYYTQERPSSFMQMHCYHPKTHPNCHLATLQV